MARFNLKKLPKCGAKTRSGKPCQRFGNKSNGRCKLHGGRSTGAKTKEGKLAIRLNALINSFPWFFNNHIDTRIKRDDIEAALNAYDILVALNESPCPETYKQMIQIIKEFRTELEALKYFIAYFYGSEALMLIQSALDHYYKDTDSQHLHFHIYNIFFPTPYFKRLISSAQLDVMKRLDIKISSKKGEFYSGKVYLSPLVKEFKRISRKLNRYFKNQQ